MSNGPAHQIISSRKEIAFRTSRVSYALHKRLMHLHHRPISHLIWDRWIFQIGRRFQLAPLVWVLESNASLTCLLQVSASPSSRSAFCWLSKWSRHALPQGQEEHEVRWTRQSFPNLRNSILIANENASSEKPKPNPPDTTDGSWLSSLQVIHSQCGHVFSGIENCCERRLFICRAYSDQEISRMPDSAPYHWSGGSGARPRAGSSDERCVQSVQKAHSPNLLRRDEWVMQWELVV